MVTPGGHPQPWTSQRMTHWKHFFCTICSSRLYYRWHFSEPILVRSKKQRRSIFFLFSFKEYKQGTCAMSIGDRGNRRRGNGRVPVCNGPVIGEIRQQRLVHVEDPGVLAGLGAEWDRHIPRVLDGVSGDGAAVRRVPGSVHVLLDVFDAASGDRLPVPGVIGLRGELPALAIEAVPVSDALRVGNLRHYPEQALGMGRRRCEGGDEWEGEEHRRSDASHRVAAEPQEGRPPPPVPLPLSLRNISSRGYEEEPLALKGLRIAPRFAESETDFVWIPSPSASLPAVICGSGLGLAMASPITYHAVVGLPNPGATLRTTVTLGGKDRPKPSYVCSLMSPKIVAQSIWSILMTMWKHTKTWEMTMRHLQSSKE